MIYNEDCKLTMSRMQDASVDLILTDPPYMTTDLQFDKDGFDYSIFAECKRILKPAGWMFMFGTVEMAIEILRFGFRRKFEYVWVKPTAMPKTKSVIRPHYQHDLIFALIHSELAKASDLYFDEASLRTAAKPYAKNYVSHKTSEYQDVCAFTKNRIVNTVSKGGREGTTILSYPVKSTMLKTERTDHPTQKPQALAELICRGYCPPDGMVYDPFLGSGTTCAAAQKTGRRWAGSEINPEYYEIARKRLHLDHAKMEQFT